MKFIVLIACVITLILVVLGGRAFAQDNCFPHAVALLVSPTEVYEDQDSSSPAILRAEAGVRFAVQGSKQVGEDCWVKAPLISSQFAWLMDNNITTGCVWEIDGGYDFKEKIRQGLDYLEEEAPRWHLYVTEHPYTIKPREIGVRNSRTNWPECSVEIHKSAFESLPELATHLVHEA